MLALGEQKPTGMAARELLTFDSKTGASQGLTKAAAKVLATEAGRPDQQIATSPAPEQHTSSAGKAVLVVGAGPAGLLAAHFLARRHGCSVEVFDRRPHPGPISPRTGEEDDDDRAFAIAMNSRGLSAIAAAGLDIAAFTSVPGSQICEVRDILLASGDGLPREDGTPGSAFTAPFTQQRMVGSRQAFVRALLYQVEQQEREASQGKGREAGQGSITFHWSTGLASVDIAVRRAAFQLADGKSLERPYDLLVGSDGYWSKVRQAAQAHGLAATTIPPNRQYKVVRGLPPCPHLPLGPTASAPYGRLCMVTEAKAGVKAAGGPPGNLFISQASKEAGVTAVLIMVHSRWKGLQGDGLEAYLQLLAAGYPSLPQAWTHEIAAQLARRPLHETGMQVHAAQLHGSALVLLGDAAHAVSPSTSNGMNSALEDALVLHQALERCGDDLAALPAAYTAARLDDVHALLWMDNAMSTLAGRAGQSAALKVSVTGRMLLHKLTAGWVRQHSFVTLKDGALPFAEARRQVQRDMTVALAVAWGGLAVLVALAAGAVLRA